MFSRRRTVLGLGGLMVGGGVLVSTGALDTVQAERSIGLETAGDANAFLSFESLDEDVVDPDAELIEFEIPGSSSVTHEELVLVTNRGTQTVTSLRFEFEVEGGDQPESDVEDAMRIVSTDADGDLTEIDAVDEINLIAASDAGDAGNNRLDPGESIPFGIRIDLIAADIDEISGDPDITLTIIAESGTVEDDPGDAPGEPQAEFELSSGPTTPTGDSDIEFTIAVTEGSPTIGGFMLEFDSTGENVPTSFEEFEIDPSAAQPVTGDGGNVDETVSHDSIELNEDDDASYTLAEFDRGPASGNLRVEFTVLSDQEKTLGRVEGDLEQDNPGQGN